MTPIKLTPLRLCLVSAVVVHLLILSAWQLQRSRQRPPQQLHAADDTPLLLQFSRQEPVESSLLTVPLPAASTLPPPNPAGSGGGAPAAHSLDTGSSPPPRKASRPPNQASARSSSPLRLHRHPTRATITPLALSSGSAARQALVTALREAASNASPTATGHGDGHAGGQTSESPMAVDATQAGERPAGIESRPQTAGLSAQPAELRLWGLGRPMPLPDGTGGGLPIGLKLRRLDLALARRSGARPIHQASLRSDDRLILFWIEGPSLWLLSAPIPSGGHAATPAGGAG